MTTTFLKRKNGDLTKLLKANFLAILDPNEENTIYVQIQGPKDTPYENGWYWLCMILTNEYPFKSPSIAFKTPIWHPNVEYDSGAICLDVLNQKWTPVFNFESIFHIFIPQLMSYPNPDDPFNQDAAIMIRNDNSKNLDSKDSEFIQFAKKINDKYALEKTDEYPKIKIQRNLIV